jgi:regulator of sigma E protease
VLEQFFGVTFTLLSFVLVLTIVVFVHEFGHFYIARQNGVHCQAFSIGFGPELFGYTDKLGTRWKFSLIPLGGYVKMLGEGETMQVIEGCVEGGKEKSKDVLRKLTPEEKLVSFKHKSVAQRAAIVFAGPAINFLFAIVVFWAMFMTIGHPVTAIKSINTKTVSRFEDIRNTVPLSDGSPMTVIVERDGAEQTLTVTPRMTSETDAFGNPAKRYVLGIVQSDATSRQVILNPIEAFRTSVGQTYEVVEGTFIAMGQIFAGKRGTEDLGGPIRIAQYSGQAAKTGVAGFIAFVAILSINLGLINLFPVPMLDGGHLLFYAIEAVRGRPLSEQAQEWGLRVGLALVGALMIFVTWNDIVHVF